MTANEVFSLPFTQVTLPILVGFFIAAVSQNKRLDDMRSDFNRRLDEIIKRLERIDLKLEDHGTRITRLEAETSPLLKR